MKSLLIHLFPEMLDDPCLPCHSYSFHRYFYCYIENDEVPKKKLDLVWALKEDLWAGIQRAMMSDVIGWLRLAQRWHMALDVVSKLSKEGSWLLVVENHHF